MSADDDRLAEAERLLTRLNEWDPVRSPVAKSPKSTGESRSRVAQLERELAALGARYARRGGVYVLIGWASRGNGGRDPDEGDR